MKTAKRVLYRGHVQGVGFRYTARNLAAKHPIAGFVRNLPNGQVELVAEGEVKEVEHFLQDVARRLGEFIEGQNEHDIEPTGADQFVIQR